VVSFFSAQTLGGDTVVGQDSIICGKARLTESVPPRLVVCRKSETRMRTENDGFDSIEFHGRSTASEEEER